MFLPRVLFSMLLTPALAHAGYVYTFERVDLASAERTSETTMQVQDGRLRIDQVDEEGERTTVLFDGARRYAIDFQHRDYSLVETEVLDRFARTPDPKRGLRDYVIAQAPAEQRLAVARIVHGGSTAALWVPSTPVTLHPTPRSGRAGRYGCRIYEARTAAATVAEYCVVPYARVEGSRELMQLLSAMHELDARLLKMLDLPVEMGIYQHAVGHFFDANVFAVGNRDLETREHTSETRLIGVKPAALAPDVFALPAGLRRIAPFAFYSGDERGSGEDAGEDDAQGADQP